MTLHYIDGGNTMNLHANEQQRFNTQQAAEYLGLKPATLATWRSLGRHKLKYQKVGRLVYYMKTDMDEWLKTRTKFHTGE